MRLMVKLQNVDDDGDEDQESGEYDGTASSVRLFSGSILCA